VFRENRENDKRRAPTITGLLPGQAGDGRHTCCSPSCTPDNFTIFEGTSEIQRMIIGHVVTLPGRAVALNCWNNRGIQGAPQEVTTILAVLLTTETAYQNPQSGNMTCQWSTLWVESMRVEYPLMTSAH
jgi:hypothetical protein